MLRCSRGNCRAIPVASCFAQPKGWQFTTKHQTGLLRHFSLHAKFASSTSQLLDIADKVTRTEAGTFACACGFHGTVGKVAKHRCQAVTGILHRVSKRANRKHGIRPAKRRYRSAASFAAALPQPSGTILVPSPESIGSYQNLMMTCAEVQKQLATPFLRLLCPASMAGKAPALNRHPRSLRVGDFIHRRRSGTYWCVKKLHLKTRMQVLELKPIECKDHDGTCWRVARRQGQPVCISATRTKLLQGGPLLHPRVATKSCSLAKRCYAKEEDVKTNEHDILSCVQIFFQNLRTSEKQHNQISQLIFEDVATLPVEYEAAPDVCPQAADTDSATCKIIKRGYMDSVRIVTSQGVFLGRRRKYSCHTHKSEWTFPLAAQVTTPKVQGHLLEKVLVDDSFWPRAWRVWVETEDWCCLQRDLRSATSDRISWALRDREDVRHLPQQAQAALHDSLLQA